MVTSERGLVGVTAAGAVGRPRVGLPAAVAAAGTGVALAAGRPAAALTAGTALAARTALAAGTALAAAEAAAIPGPGPGHLVHLGRRVTQRRTDVIDLDLIDRALLAFLGLIRPLPQPPRDDHPHPAGQALRHVLRRLPPHGARQEDRKSTR